MKAEISMTQKEAIQLLQRLMLEADFKGERLSRKALEMAIEAMKELQDIKERCTDDGK